MNTHQMSFISAPVMTKAPRPSVFRIASVCPPCRARLAAIAERMPPLMMSSTML